jgi:hypothetical protein
MGASSCAHSSTRAWRVKAWSSVSDFRPVGPDAGNLISFVERVQFFAGGRRMDLRRCLGACLFALAWTGAAGANDLFTYDTPGEKLTAGVIAPFGRREIVRRTTESCGKAFPEMAFEARATLVLWTQRQSGFLDVAAALRDRLAATAEKAGNKKGAAQWRKFVAEVLPKQIDMAGRMTDMALDESGADLAAKRSLCRELMDKVASGRADLDRWDPVNAKYLREFAGKDFKEGKAKAEVGSRGRAANASSRTDAAALLGHWKLIHSTSYLLDGTVAESTATPCSFDFSADKLASECAPAGRKMRIVYSYRVPAPGRYELEVLENAGRPDSVGMRSESSFRVEGDDLFVTGYPPTSARAPEKSPLMLESVSHRETR